MSDRYTSARKALYDAHDQDPTRHKLADGTEIAYETHYANRMEHFLTLRDPDAAEVLKLAVIGQHFQRWEVPRSDYPMTKPGYHSWRTGLKKRQAEQVSSILAKHGYSEEEVEKCAALIKKDGLKQGEEEVQVLEDVACLVFLDDQFDEFKNKHDDEKIVTILQKTWVKMSEKGHKLALQLPMTDECKALVQRALSG